MSNKFNLYLEISYKGTEYSGSQLQKNSITIQELLNRALQKLFVRKEITTIFSGRTDAGVHAMGQCVTVKVDKKIPEANVKKALNSLLPNAIRVSLAGYKEEKFHAQYNARRRKYYYNIYWGDIPPVFLADFVWHIDKNTKLNLPLMLRAAKVLKGKYDFSALCASNSSIQDKVRTVYVSSLKVKKIADWPGSMGKAGKLLTYCIEADGFLYHMVRNIIAALVDIGAGRLSIAQFKKILAIGKRENLKSITAPAKGLVLYKVKY